MYKEKSVLSLIPARAGSKRLPGKNLKVIAGIPLIAHTIEAARRSRLVDRIVVSTECPLIAAVAVEYGAEAPFLRPDDLAGDDASSEDVIRHALAELGQFDYVALLQPTSPLRVAATIDGCIAMCIDRVAHSSVTAYPLRHGGRKLLAIGENSGVLGRASMSDLPNNNLKEPFGAFQENGAVYVLDTRQFLASGQIIGAGSVGIEMSEWESVDIDFQADFDAAEALLLARK